MQPNEVEQLWVRYRRDRDPGVRERLIVQYAPLVKYVIGRIGVSMPGVLGTEDLIGYGTIGLIQAVDRFDPTVGVKFETYAIQRIRGSILDTVRNLSGLSRDTTRRARELERAYEELTHKLGRVPSNREVAGHLGLSADEFYQALSDASISVTSLNNPVGGEGDGDERPSLIDQIADEGTPEVGDQVERRQLYKALVRAIEALPERDRLVINLYYYEELTLKEIGQILNVSTSRVSQLHTAAVLKLRAALKTSISPALAA